MTFLPAHYKNTTASQNVKWRGDSAVQKNESEAPYLRYICGMYLVMFPLISAIMSFSPVDGSKYVASAVLTPFLTYMK